MSTWCGARTTARAARWTLAVLGVCIMGAVRTPPSPRARTPHHRHAAAQCAVCHPAAVEGLRDSAHGSLLTSMATIDAACIACHGEQSEHGAAARFPELPQVATASVETAACAVCHGPTPRLVGTAVHPWRDPGSTAPPAAADPPAPEPSWNAGFDLGLRFVDIDGSRDTHATDVDLSDGLRLLAFDFGVDDVGTTWFDSLSLRTRGLADPDQVLDLRVAGNTNGPRLTAKLERRDFEFRASGAGRPFHEVSRERRRARLGLVLPASEPGGLEWSAGYGYDASDANWLTQRVGTRSTLPQTVFDGVESPRALRADTFDAGLRQQLDDIEWSLGADYRDEVRHERWSYTDVEPSNPAAIASETFESDSTLRGPTLRGRVRAEPSDAVALSIEGHVHRLDRRTIGDGVLQGFDVDRFVTVVDSDSMGDAHGHTLRTLGEVELSDHVVFLLEAGWRSARENLTLQQVEATTFDVLGSTLSSSRFEQRTSSRRFDAAAEFSFALHRALDCGLGYAFARESLRVPEFAGGSSDFVATTLYDHGALASVHWRPTAAWSLRGALTERDRAQGGQIHEHDPREQGSQSLRVRYRPPGSGWSVEVFGERSLRRNPRSAHRSEHESFGASVESRLGATVDARVSFTHSSLASRTLTNFFFDPDPAPVPTVVGFDGRTDALAGGFEWRVGERLRLSSQATWTSTRGSFDVDWLDWRAECTCRTWTDGELGLSLRRVDYDEDVSFGGDAAHRASLLLLFWRQRIGGAGLAR